MVAFSPFLTDTATHPFFFLLVFFLFIFTNLFLSLPDPGEGTEQRNERPRAYKVADDGAS